MYLYIHHNAPKIELHDHDDIETIPNAATAAATKCTDDSLLKKKTAIRSYYSICFNLVA